MPLKKKVSYGIICFRKNAKNTLQLLMIKKAITHYFSAFVNGYYMSNPNNTKSDRILKKLFNNMSYHEKLDILSFNFKTLWERIYRTIPINNKEESKDDPNSNSNQTVNLNSHANANANANGKHIPKFGISYNLYKKREYKFNSLCSSRSRVMHLIKNSSNMETPWEFPKGRKDSDAESDLNTAIREFSEETNLKETDFKILYHITPYVQTYTDFGRTYQNIYYFAEILSNTIEPRATFLNHWQMSEICDIRWVSKDELANMNLEEITYNRLLKSFTKIIKKYNSAKC